MRGMGDSYLVVVDWRTIARRRLGTAHLDCGGDSHRIEATRGDDHFYDRAGISVGKAQTSAEFIDTLSHTTDADSDALWPKLDYSLFDSFAIVAHGHYDLAVILAETYFPIAST